MALEIQATPYLKGKNAENFFNHLQDVDNYTPSEKDMKEALRTYANYKEIKKVRANNLPDGF